MRLFLAVLFLISAPLQAENLPAPAESPVYLYTVADFNFRFKPNGKLIQMIKTGEKVEVLGRNGEWYKIRYDDEVGYIHGSGLSHPDLDKLPYSGVFGILDEYSRLEVAACISSIDSQVLDKDTLGFVESVRKRMALEGHSEPVEALIQAARKSAAKCRNFAPHVCTRLGKGHPCGVSCDRFKSKGWCKAGVREAVETALGFTIGGGSALASEKDLAGKMARLNSVKSCDEAPVGSICVYEAAHHEYGHVEIKTGKEEYCSDFCAARPVRGSYKFRGAYYP